MTTGEKTTITILLLLVFALGLSILDLKKYEEHMEGFDDWYSLYELAGTKATINTITYEPSKSTWYYFAEIDGEDITIHIPHHIVVSHNKYHSNREAINHATILLAKLSKIKKDPDSPIHQIYHQE